MTNLSFFFNVLSAAASSSNAILLFSFSAVSALTALLMFLNNQAEFQKQELILLREQLNNVLTKLDVIDSHTNNLGHSFFMRGDLNVTYLLVGILLVGVIVGVVSVYTFSSDTSSFDPKLMANQFTESVKDILLAIMNHSENILETNEKTTNVILQQLEALQEQMMPIFPVFIEIFLRW
jgi:hypothetical protein